MTHIICRANTCVFWEQGVCSAEEIEYDPDEGCQTYQDIGDLDVEDPVEEDDDLYWGARSDGASYEDDEDEDDDEDWDDDWEEDEEDEDDDLDF